MDIKLIIIGIDTNKCIKLAQNIVKINDNLSISPKFSTNENYRNLNELMDYYLSINEIYLAYKNNALLYVHTDNNNISSGVTMDDFINNDITIIPIRDFNMISDKPLQENNILIVWVDSKSTNNENFNEIKYLQDRLQNYKYMYFYQEEIDTIAQTIIDYLDAPEELKIEILENNS